MRRADGAGDDVRGVQADAHPHGLLAARGALDVPLRDGAHDAARGRDGAGGVVGPGDRRAEEHHHAIADVFVHRAALLEHRAGDALKKLVEKGDRLLRRHPLGARGEAADVHEEHRDLARNGAVEQLVAALQLVGDVGRHEAAQSRPRAGFREQAQLARHDHRGERRGDDQQQDAAHAHPRVVHAVAEEPEIARQHARRRRPQQRARQAERVGQQHQVRRGDIGEGRLRHLPPAEMKRRVGLEQRHVPRREAPAPRARAPPVARDEQHDKRVGHDDVREHASRRPAIDQRLQDRHARQRQPPPGHAVFLSRTRAAQELRRRRVPRRAQMMAPPPHGPGGGGQKAAKRAKQRHGRDPWAPPPAPQDRRPSPKRLKRARIGRAAGFRETNMAAIARCKPRSAHPRFTA